MSNLVEVQLVVKEAAKSIVDVANPYHFLKIKEEFDHAPISAGKISELEMPAETRVILESMIEAISGTESNAYVEGALSELVSVLAQREILIWRELEFFLDISEIKKLSNNSLKKIMCQINQKNTENLRELVVQLFDKEVLKNINDFLHNSEYEDMETLLAEIVNFMPVKKDGMLFYWNRPANFFEKKTVYLKNPVSSQSHSGNVVKCVKENNGFYFQLHDQSEVIISSNYSVKFTEILKMKFWDSICHSNLRRGEKFELKYRGGSCSIRPGSYTIESIKISPRDSGMWNNIWNGKVNVTRNRPLSCTEISMKSTEEPSQICLISAYHFKDDNELQKVELKIDSSTKRMHSPYDSVKSEYVKLLQIPNDEFCEYFYLFVRTHDMHGINEKNIDSQILVKDERDEAHERRIHFKEIEKQLAEILQMLLSTDNCQLLDQLIASLINMNLTGADVEILVSNHSHLLDRLKDISKDYKIKLDIIRAPSDILKSLVIEANYVSIIKKEKCNEVARTMELLKDSEKHIKDIKGKDAIFFIGNTGSGKSTTIGYFMGARMEYFFNSVGDKVIKITDEQEDKFPQIGQALGESETLYTSCYPTAVENIYLVDCPGFNDTRGGDYEICANLSIDQAVERSGRLKAIVVIIPVQSFLTDRANGVIELVEVVRSRFPFAFDAKCRENSRVYILITKSSQAQVESAKALESGKRYQVLLEEARQAMSRNESGNDDFSPMHQRGMQMRASIWEAFVNMNINKQIDFIDTSNMRMKRRLIDKYAAEGNIEKGLYVKAMQGADMKRKFGKDVEMAADTWSKHIITRYQEDLPKSLGDKAQEISVRKKKLKELSEESAKIKENIESRCLTLKTAKKAKGQASLDGVELPAEILSSIQEMKESELSKISNDIEDLDNSYEKCSRGIVELREKVITIKKNIDTTDEHVLNLSEEIDKLSKGTFKDVLWTKDFRGMEEATSKIRFIKNATRQERFLEGVELQDEDYTGETSTCIYKDYEGTFLHEAYIERKYCIVPKDKCIREIFQTSCKFQQFEASLEGENFEVDLGMIAEATGKSVRYGFQTIWKKGGKMPWIEISHTIPNSEYNSSTIVNKNGEIGALNANKAELEVNLEGNDTIAGKRKELLSLEKELESIADEKISLETSRQKLEQGILEKCLDQMIEDLTHKINRYEIREKEIPKAIENIESEILVLEKDIKNLLWTKKRLALIIYYNWNVVELLQSFTERIVKGATEIEDRSGIATSCRSFIDAYNKHKDSMLMNSKKDMGIA